MIDAHINIITIYKTLTFLNVHILIIIFQNP